MKSVIIIAIAFVLLIPITAYADIQVTGTTISGSSDADMVKISINFVLKRPFFKRVRKGKTIFV